MSAKCPSMRRGSRAAGAAHVSRTCGCPGTTVCSAPFAGAWSSGCSDRTRACASSRSRSRQAIRACSRAMASQEASRRRSCRFSLGLSFYLREVWFPTFSRRRATVSGRHRRVLAGPPPTTPKIAETDVGVLRYPLSATAAEKPLPHKGPESFPSWTSGRRRFDPGRPLFVRALTRQGFFFWPLGAAR